MTLVSSPHRYCQNSSELAERIPYALFQALIGTAKTRAGSADRFHSAVFQALIGTAKTDGDDGVADSRDSFQALIGTAKTGRAIGGPGRTMDRFKPS